MRYLVFALLSLTPLTIVTQGCKTTQTQQAQTLEAVGVAAKLTIDTAAILLAEGKISVEKFQAIALFYDTKFQPAFKIALKHVEGNSKNPAPLQLVALSLELSNLLKQ